MLRTKFVKAGKWVTLEGGFGAGSEGLSLYISEPVGAKIKVRWGLPFWGAGWDTQEQTLDGKSRYLSVNPSEMLANPRMQIKVKQDTTVTYEVHTYSHSDEYPSRTTISNADSLHRERIASIKEHLHKLINEHDKTLKPDLEKDSKSGIKFFGRSQDMHQKVEEKEKIYRFQQFLSGEFNRYLAKEENKEFKDKLDRLAIDTKRACTLQNCPLPETRRYCTHVCPPSRLADCKGLNSSHEDKDKELIIDRLIESIRDKLEKDIIPEREAQKDKVIPVSKL